MTVLDKIMGVQEAGKLWQLHPDSVKKLCQEGKLEARVVGRDWILTKDQPNPKKRIVKPR